MRTILNYSTNPKFNLALEEYILKYLNLEEDIALVWQNEKCLIIGKNENPFISLNRKFIFNNEIPVYRNVNDCKFVYDNLQNINFAFVTKTSEDYFQKFKVYLKHIVKILARIGIQTQIRNKNHLFIEDKQISSYYVSYFQDKMLHHWTLSLNTEIDVLEHALKDYTMPVSKSHNTKAITLTNNKHNLQNETAAILFKDLFIIELLVDKSNKIYELDTVDLNKINKLMEEKYDNWSWNYGETPKFLLKKEYDERLLVTLIINKGIIKDVSIDAFENVIFLEKSLLNVQFSDETLRKALNKCKNIDVDKMVEALLF